MTTCSVLVHNSSGQELRVQIKPVSHGASVTVAPCVADGRMATFPIRESVELCLCRETVMVYQGILNTDSLKTYCLFASAQGVKLQTLDFSQAQPLIFPDLEGIIISKQEHIGSSSFQSQQFPTLIEKFAKIFVDYGWVMSFKAAGATVGCCKLFSHLRASTLMPYNKWYHRQLMPKVRTSSPFNGSF